MKICFLLPYANPHDTGWIDEFIANSNHQITIGIVNSVRKYRSNHFEEADNKRGYLYFFKEQRFKKEFYQQIRECDYFITLGIFEPWFLKAVYFMRKSQKIFVLSEPLRPANENKSVIRKIYVRLLKSFKKSGKFYFLCMGGVAVKQQYLSFGFSNSTFYQFGHFPKLNLTLKTVSSKISVIKFIFVGQLIVRKGVDILISALNYLKTKYVNWEFVIIGNGTLQQELLNTFKDEKRLKYVENIDGVAEMKSFYNNSHILFLPSYFDGWGAVVNEALSSSCSLLLSQNVYAGVMLLRNNENGFRFNPHQISELYTAIDKYFTNPEILNDHFNTSKEIFLEWNHKNAAISFDNMLNGKENLQNKTLLQVI